MEITLPPKPPRVTLTLDHKQHKISEISTFKRFHHRSLTTNGGGLKANLTVDQAKTLSFCLEKLGPDWETIFQRLIAFQGLLKNQIILELYKTHLKIGGLRRILITNRERVLFFTKMGKKGCC